MKIVTAAEMREIDRITTEKYGIPSLTLMENAGDGVTRFLLRPYSGVKRRIAVVCGKGNNGGDGFVVARKLHEQRKEVTVLLLARPADVKGDAKVMMERLPFAPISFTASEELQKRADLISETDLIVDAIFGTGFRPPLPELAAKAVELIGKSAAKVVSVDLPSGVDADSFELHHPNACRSDGIVSFTAPKPALVFGTLTRGAIAVHQIGTPEGAVSSKLGLEWNAPPDILRYDRPLNSNKGLYGHALVIGGAFGKSGAPTMASMAALRVGAGLVTCAVPKSILSIVAGFIPELMTEALEENSVGVAGQALDEHEYRFLTRGKRVVALGPGMGQDPDTQVAIRSFVKRRSELPLVLDADGLNAFQGDNLKALGGGGRPLVLTPHPGEMARMLGKSVPEIEADRIGVARSFATKMKVILVLKGWRTLISDPDGNIWVNTTGNPGLAKGGSGDVLTGMVAGLIAQFPDRIAEAVRAAVYLHGLAADFALLGETENTMLATDVIAKLPAAFRDAQRSRDRFTWLQRGIRRR